MEEAERLTKIENSEEKEDCNDFSKELMELPHITKYIVKLQNQIKEQQNKIQTLQESLLNLQSQTELSKENQCHNQTQTNSIEAECCNIEIQTDSFNVEHCHIQTQTDSTNNKDQNENENKSLVDEIKQAAELSMLQTGFVYEQTSGLYYDYKSGYYYDAKSGLYYDGNSGIYYYYDTEKKSFQYHYKIDAEASKQTANSKNISNVNEKDDDSDIEEGELIECIDLTDSDIEKRYSSKNSRGVDKKESMSKAEIIKPCIRIIVKETDVPNIKVGSLFIVSFQGGSIGREGDHAVLIPDINISKHHAKLQYNESEKYYEIIDLGSRNGTYLNGKRLSSAKQESEPKEIIHGSTLQMNSTKLLCHIHNGYETCGHCEPGLIQSDCLIEDFNSKSTKSKHQTELKRLKAKFGIEYTNPGGSIHLDSNYQDRAQLRRENFGSSSDHVKTEQSSVNESISKNNMGFKMLKKMGWAEGTSLGKSGDGEIEPVLVQQNFERTGLGAEGIYLDHGLDDLQSTRKRKILVKTKNRFDQIDSTAE